MIEWYVVTVNGYWGKGEDIYEAAKNASIYETQVRAHVYRINTALATKVGVTDIGGLCWQWEEELFYALEEKQIKLDQIQDCMDLGYFLINIRNKKVNLSIIHE